MNIDGEVLPDPVALKKYTKAPPKPKAEEKSYHKGWRVIGIPPGALEEARDDHRRVVEMAAKSGGREIKPFDEANWLQNHRGKPVRAKPYEIKSSAEECAALAEKGGWLRVRVEEMKREVSKNPSSAFA
ncbi:hypothetical protein [Acidovorax sp. LjRoot117]|uniref:hypothetical protein n=1 Tax=Acidovorax sp. LjRoot117 TaxID=3342255 RepID=UPI003ECE03CD